MKNNDIIISRTYAEGGSIAGRMDWDVAKANKNNGRISLAETYKIC